MRILLILTLILTFAMAINGQDFKTLIADGTKYTPDKQAQQPTVERLSAEEIADVKKEALRTQVEFEVSPQEASAEETSFQKDFELRDVAQGFFISREIEYKAFLYTAWSAKLKRNYQGIMVLNRFKNRLGAQLSRVLAHYVYRYQGDKFIRKLADINRNRLDEIAVFSQLSTKIIIRRLVRIIEFSPVGIEKLGFTEIYSHINQKQLTPRNGNGGNPTNRVYIPPVVKALKIFVKSESGKKPIFSGQEFKQNGDDWTKTEELAAAQLQADLTDYVEIVRSISRKELDWIGNLFLS